MTSVDATTPATKIRRYPIITEYSGGYCCQFLARNSPSQNVLRVSARKNENTIDAIPSSLRMVPWM